jgi:hypothetical protein
MRTQRVLKWGYIDDGIGICLQAYFKQGQVYNYIVINHRDCMFIIPRYSVVYVDFCFAFCSLLFASILISMWKLTVIYDKAIYSIMSRKPFH